MPMIRDRALCLRKTEYSETSQVLMLFGREHGMVRVLAKGAHRRTKAGASKFDGGIDLLDLGDGVYIERTGRDLSLLTEWKQLDGHLGLRRSLRGILLGQSVAELMVHLVPDADPQSAVFDRVEATLPHLAGERGEEHFLALVIDILDAGGYLPDLTEAPTNERNAGLRRIAQTLQHLPRDKCVIQRPPRLTREQTVPLMDLLFRHVRQITNRPLLTRDFLPG